jgi:hypothetical protein
VPDPTPECPLPRKAMVRLDISEDTHFRCSRRGCIVHWNPADILFYLKTKGDWPLRDGD